MKLTSLVRCAGSMASFALLSTLASAAQPGPESASALSGNYDFRVLVSTGDAAPGAPGEHFGRLVVWGLNNHGQVAFEGYVAPADPEQLGRTGIFRYDRSRDRVAQIISGAEPGPGGEKYDYPFSVTLDAQGNVAFTEVLESPTKYPTGVNYGVYAYSASTGRVRAVVTPNVTPAPSGGVFAGSATHEDFDAHGNVIFAGMYPTTDGIAGPRGIGVFRSAGNGAVTPVLAPGDAAPGGGTFDFAYIPSVNDHGDAAIGAHIHGEECVGHPENYERLIQCGTGVYVKSAGGAVRSIVRLGDAAPGGGAFRFAYGPRINTWGNVAFLGDLTPPPDMLAQRGLFLYHAALDRTIPIVRPGDALPGGGIMLNASSVRGGKHAINALNQVAFTAYVTPRPGSYQEMGLYLWSHGSVRLIARAGTVLPGIGTVRSIWDWIDQRPALNDLGQIAFNAMLEDGRDVVVLGTPRP